MRRTRWVLLLVWLAVTVAWGAHYVRTHLAAALSGPDEYAMTWQFQALMFAIFRLPVLVVVLLVSLFLSPSRRLRSPSGSGR